ncbi:hypothetical protein [Vibrio europaeus]|uniref:hypothetical protein n=1 Tax=Vibrio europaeus TaxID=300876 RepID=UPI00148C8643|nr:hypothetical protein [Vibrio europaeus]NOH22346.1 hypothetical protein [Vibrio europaeus]
MALEKFKTSVFDAIQLDNVIWVDDRFSTMNQSIVSDYLQHVEATAEANPDSIAQFKNFIELGIDVTAPFQLWKELIPKNDETISDYYQHVGSAQPDFTTTEFNELINIFDVHSKGNINKLSLSDWQAQKTHWLSDNSRNLFLIDYNFEHENASETYGKIIIEEILENKSLTDIYCVLFTSEAKHGKEEEEKRNKIINEINSDCNNYNFSVLSKSIISDEEEIPIVFKTSEFVKRIFLRKLSAEMVDSISNSLVSSINDLKRDLNQHSIYEIDRSIFSNSLSEGASEFDLLQRLFAIKQQQSINALLAKDPTVTRKLSDFRSVQSVAFKGKSNKVYKDYLHKLISVSNKFANLRMNEIFDSSINSTHSPLSSGDIFRFGDKDYILIEQACDLSVRGNTGKRKLKEAILIPFKETELKNETPEEMESFAEKVRLDKFYMLKIPSAKSNDFYCLFDFSQAITVNINWLDLCVFNACGSLKLSHSHRYPALLHLPGWRIKFDDIVKKLEPVSVQSHYQSAYNMSPRAPKGDVDALRQDFLIFTFLSEKRFNTSISTSKLEIAGQRTKRLRENFMELLSRAYFIGYKTRGALGNDFSM